MQTKIFPCQPVADDILKKSQREAEAFAKKHGRPPQLTVVLVGEDPASKIYVQKKSEMCRKHGVLANDVHLKVSSQSGLEKIIHQLNADRAVDGILVQSPLPRGFDPHRIYSLIATEKDVDCFHPFNVGQLTIDAKQALAQGMVPCTPAGVMEVLRANKIATDGANAVVLGRSTIVGKPMALMLQAANATVTMCHSRTKDLPAICRTADILVAAIGKAKFVTKDFVKPGAAVIDVGINRLLINGKPIVVGDVNTRELDGVAGFVTPVPKGIGPMTIAMLIRNTVRAAFLREEKKSPI